MKLRRLNFRQAKRNWPNGVLGRQHLFVIGAQCVLMEHSIYHSENDGWYVRHVWLKGRGRGRHAYSKHQELT